MIYLYVKTHNITGLRYFGKTTRNPFKYKGSGKYWRRHIAKHGNDVTTQIIAEFNDEVECTKFALNFSIENDIVNSPTWANLQNENGLDGAPEGHTGHKFTTSELKKISDASKAVWQDPEFREKMSALRKKAWTEKRRSEQRNRLLGTKRPEHSIKMKGRALPPAAIEFSKQPKSDSHKAAISNALKGKAKSEDHKKKLQVPKPLVVCRIHDKRLMALGNFMKWYNSQVRSNEIPI